MLSLSDVLDRVTSGLAALPGAEAQQRMAPVPRRGWRPGLFPEDARPAASLLLIYASDGGPAILLTKRSAALPTHRGQVSMPGGAVDPGETLEQAALREALEEVGLPSNGVRILGRLSPMHIPVSGFVLHPVVATLDGRPALHIASGEVDRLIEVRVRDLVDPARHRRTTRVRDGLEFDMPYFDLDGEEVWGATAMVLAEFSTILGVPPDPR
jgi:8-oxo-dGTP pyrophosphatase MutT (NUDIX family)